jgi:DNA-binding response OmpR family regulator
LAHVLVGEDSFERGIDVQVFRLRRELMMDADLPNLIQTVRGIGYALADSVERL